MLYLLMGRLLVYLLILIHLLGPCHGGARKKTRPAITPPEIAGHIYEIREGHPLILGKGSAGTTFLARDTNNESRRVVIKVTPATHRPSLLHEYSIMRRLNHPNIPKVLQFVDGETPALIMQLIDGISVSQMIQRKISPPHDRLPNMIAQLMCILYYIHTMGIGHLDVYPGNVIITDDGNEVYLIDFGAALTGLHPTRGFIGSTRRRFKYLDPHARFSNGGDFGMSVDYYGVALVLYALHTGTFANLKSNPRDLNLMTGDPPVDQVISILINSDQTGRWARCFSDFPQSFKELPFFASSVVPIEWDVLLTPAAGSETLHNMNTPSTPTPSDPDDLEYYYTYYDSDSDADADPDANPAHDEPEELEDSSRLRRQDPAKTATPVSISALVIPMASVSAAILILMVVYFVFLLAAAKQRQRQRQSSVKDAAV